MLGGAEGEMKRRRTLITSPLEWQMTAAPVPHAALPVVAERGGTELRTPRPVVVVDSREQNPFSFARFRGWFAGMETQPLELGEEIVASYLYQVFLYHWLETNDYGRCLAEDDL